MAGKKIRPRTSQSSVSGGGSTSKRPSDELLAMTKEQLKNECRKRGQKSTGNKTELLQRLGLKMTTNTKRNANTATNGAALTPDELPGGSGDPNEKMRKENERREKESLVLWKRPVTTLEYSAKEVFILLTTYGKK